MSEPTFGIYIPSYKRANTCTAHRFLQYGTYIVRASEEAEYREALRDVLALDPRPRYQQDPDRVYGFLFAGQEVRFTVDGDRLQVVDIK